MVASMASLQSQLSLRSNSSPCYDKLLTGRVHVLLFLVPLICSMRRRLEGVKSGAESKGVRNHSRNEVSCTM